MQQCKSKCQYSGKPSLVGFAVLLMLSFGTDGFGSDVFLDGSGPDDERTTLPLPPPLAVPTATALPPPPAEASQWVMQKA